MFGVYSFIHVFILTNRFILVMVMVTLDTSSYECSLWPYLCFKYVFDIVLKHVTCIASVGISLKKKKTTTTFTFSKFSFPHTDETQKLLKDLAHRKPLQVPNIFHHLPHLLNNEGSLHPAVQVGQGRTGGKHLTALQQTPSTTILHFLYIHVWLHNND